MSAVRRFASIEEIRAAVGTTLGHGHWLTVTQDRVDGFAGVTEDYPWIHVDRDRAARGPFGGTIAHGYLTLSLVPHLGHGVYAIDVPGPRVNYGLNSVRFPTPVPVGGRVRGAVSVVELRESGTGHLLVLRTVVELEGAAKPACVAESLVMLLGEAGSAHP